MEVGQVHETGLSCFGKHFSLDKRSVVWPQAEADQGTHVAQRRFDNSLVSDLGDELVGEDHPQTEFPPFREQADEILRGNTLELVHEDIKLPSGLRRNLDPRHRCGLQFGEEKHAEKSGVGFR